jgi:hypothetical protein
LSSVVLVRCTARFSVSVVVAVLLLALCFTAFSQSAMPNFARASSALPFDNVEYANGTIIPAHSDLNIWYDWVNVSGTQVINYALYTTPDYPYPVPIANLLGQHFHLADGTDVFVASGLSKFEVYRDLNGDGIPQANFTSGDSEILYYMYTNMSDSYSMTPIQKVMKDSTPHYLWGLTYVNAYAYLMRPTGYDLVAKLIFDHITIGYDFSVNGNVSDLKTNFDIGKVSSLEPLTSSEVSLDGLSLALLYVTSVYASKPYSTSVNGQPYNSTTAQESATSADIAQVAVGDKKAYDFLFGGNYTLNRGENNETHQANIETHEVQTEAASLSSLPTVIYGSPLWQLSFFRDQLDLADLFGGSWPEFNMDYNGSSLIYRICFPVWDGMQIQQDPVYVAYLSSNAPVPEFPEAFVLPILITATLLILAIAKARKHSFIKQG